MTIFEKRLEKAFAKFSELLLIEAEQVHAHTTFWNRWTTDSNDHLFDSTGSLNSWYRRSKAIKDGVLIDLTTRCQKLGYTVPVAMRCELMWHHFAGEDHLLAALSRFKRNKTMDEVTAMRSISLKDFDHWGNEQALVLWVGKGDNGETVLTLMYGNRST